MATTLLAKFSPMDSGREVTSLPLSRSLINKLVENGFILVKSLLNVRALELAHELGVTAEEAQQVLQCVKSTEDVKIQSAKDLIVKRSVGKGVITFCKELDTALIGGIPLGQITELCGIPGVGKSQLAMQLAVNVQIPEIFGGNGGEAIYIDTEGGFMVERVAEMASAVSAHLNKISKSRKMEQKSRELGVDLVPIASAMTMNRFLEGITVFRVHDQVELLALIDQLPGLLALNSKIRMVIIDSIAFHFRQSLQDTAGRSRILTTVSQQLNQVAYDSQCAICLTNHMTTKIEWGGYTSTMDLSSLGSSSNTSGTFGANTSTSIVPALGDVWSHCVTNRLLLSWQGDYRVATIVKSPAWPSVSVPFIVSALGMRDVPPIVPEGAEAANGNGRKRKVGDVAES